MTTTMTDTRTVECVAARFELYDPARNHDKFWEFVMYERYVSVHWGRNGTQGQYGPKRFPSERDASNFVDTKVSEKRKKGYVPVGIAAFRFPAPPSFTTDVAVAVTGVLDDQINAEVLTGEQQAVFAEMILSGFPGWAAVFTARHPEHRPGILRVITEHGPDAAVRFVNQKWAGPRFVLQWALV